jgi:sulfite reductase (NADPH) hemoprotein beta-component
MYRYNDFDEAFVRQRVEEFRHQVKRRVDGVLTEDEFKPLRLQNGLYLQLHAYMMRVAIPYGTLNSRQMRQLAHIAETYDRGYGHFTTRQNIQFNWIDLPRVAEALADLADVEMHAIQTSGNCIRNVTADHFAGAVADEVEDPRVVAELLRQWSMGHPEYAFLPRKFKIAVTGSEDDRAVVAFHDIGLKLRRNEAGVIGAKIFVGGGLGRTPRIGRVLRDFLPMDDLLPYIDQILHVYNRYGRRDNKYKARIKIMVDELGIDEVRRRVEDAVKASRKDVKPVSATLKASIQSAFAPPDFCHAPSPMSGQDFPLPTGFDAWLVTNIHEHRDRRHAIVSISLKDHGATPGDASADQMRAMADIAQEFGYDELRVSHEQNIILPHVPKAYLPTVYDRLKKAGLATANIGLISDIIACPGMDYCALATARSIPIAQDIASHFDQLKLEQDIGPLKVKISGCINACGHHHVGHIGILGLDRAGVENYQITLGGDGSEGAALGERLGPGFPAEELLGAIDAIVAVYLEGRRDRDETFLEFTRRVGLSPFKQRLYPALKSTAKTPPHAPVLERAS